MPLPNPTTYLGWGAAILPLLGTIITFLIRRHRWMMLVWLPVTTLVAYEVIWLISKLAGFGAIRGPDAIGVGIAQLVLLLSIIAGIGALFVCLIARPRREQMQTRVVICTLLLNGGLVFSLIRIDRTILSQTYSINFCDELGHPHQSIPVSVTISESALPIEKLGLNSGEAGFIDFRLRKNQDAEVRFAPSFPAKANSFLTPTEWTIRIHPNPLQKRIEVRHLWNRSVGADTPVHESLQEFIPSADLLELKITVPKRSGIDSTAMMDRARSALKAGVSPALVAGNIDALGCISEMIASSAVEGLRQSSRIISELENSRQKLAKKFDPLLGSLAPSINSESQIQLMAWRRWTGASASSPAEILRSADVKIDAYVRELTDFALSRLPSGADESAIINELNGCRPFVGIELRLALLKNPPSNVTAIQGWGRSLWSFTILGNRLDYVRSLLTSGNPHLVLVACEALGNQLESEGGAFALDRLKATRSDIVEKEIAARADMWIAELEFRLKRKLTVK